MQLLHKAGVFLYTRNAKGLSLSTNSIDKIVIGNGRCADGALDVGGITECDSFVGGLNEIENGRVGGTWNEIRTSIDLASASMTVT